MAARVLENLGIDLTKVRMFVFRELLERDAITFNSDELIQLFRENLERDEKTSNSEEQIQFFRELLERDEKISNSNEQIQQNDTAANYKDKVNKTKQTYKEIDNSEENDLVSQLERLASLKREGLLTNKEFDEAKRRLLF